MRKKSDNSNPKDARSIRANKEGWNNKHSKHFPLHPNLECDHNFYLANLSGIDVSGLNLSGRDFRKTLFNNADLFRTKLIGCDLSDAHLEFAVLNRADLRNADLRNAYLNNCNLRGADLTDADLRGARLENLDFSNAILKRTKFQNARLFTSTFSNSNLYDTDFTGTAISNCGFSNVDLSMANLSKADLWGPNSIGIDTLVKTLISIREGEARYKNVKKFVKHSGVPKFLLKIFDGVFKKDSSFYSVFISYCHQDKSFAIRLHDALSSKGVRCWLDEHHLVPGDEIHTSIADAIEVNDKVVLCCSESSLASWWVENEITATFKKEEQLSKRLGKRSLILIPLTIDDFLFSGKWNSGWSSIVGSRLAGDFREWLEKPEVFENCVEDLLKALRDKGDSREEKQFTEQNASHGQP